MYLRYASEWCSLCGFGGGATKIGAGCRIKYRLMLVPIKYNRTPSAVLQIVMVKKHVLKISDTK